MCSLKDRRLKQVYNNIKRRCTNIKSKFYPSYGGLGVRCLFTNFTDFKEWAYKNGYTDDKQVKRISNKGNYSPYNLILVNKRPKKSIPVKTTKKKILIRRSDLNNG